MLAVSCISADEEQDLISVLQSPTGVVQKCNACLRLRTVGTARSVPTLASLLGEERISHAACHVLETMPCPEAGAALRGALDKTPGLVKAGIINTLGIRRDHEAVPALVKLLTDPDMQIAAAAITALGNIAGPESITALNTMKTGSSPVLQAPLHDALLKCAAELTAPGDKKTAYKIYSKIYDSKTPQHFRVAAYRGLISTSDEKKALKLIEKGLKGRDKSSLMASLQMAGELKGESAAKTFSELLPELQPGIQGRFIDVLAQHGDLSILSALLSAADSPSPDVRAASLKALGKMGNESVVPVLLKSLAGPKDAEQEAAREALIRLRGRNTSKAIADNFPKVEGPAKLEVIRILGLRNDASVVPFLMKMTEDETVGTISLQSLSLLVNETSIKELIELLFRAKDDNRRKEIEKALVSACIRSRNKKQSVVQIISALKGADLPNKCTLLRACGSLSGSEVLNALRDGIKNNDKDVQDTAVRSLASLQDPEAITDQLAYAKNTSSQTYRILLLRGCMKLVDETTSIPADKKMEICKDIMGIADRTEEKMLVISCLGKISTIGSLKMLEPFLSDSALKSAAATAMFSIGRIPDISRTDAAKPLLQKAGEVLKK